MAIQFVNNLEINQNSLDNAVIQNLATDPITGKLGQLLFNTSSGELKVCTTAQDTAATPVVNAVYTAMGAGGVDSITTSQTGVSTGDTLTALTTATGAVTINSFSYNGGSNIGYVPSGGTGTTFLRGDGTFATPAGGGTMSSWDLAADSGTTQSVADGNIVNFRGDTNGGISTKVDASVTDQALLFKLDINDLSTNTEDIAGGDFIAFADITDGNNTKKVTVTDLLALAPQGDVTEVKASTEIDELGIKVTDPTGPIPKIGLDIANQTALGATPATDDELLIYDLSATTNKKVTVANLLAGAADTTYTLPTTVNAGGNGGVVSLNDGSTVGSVNFKTPNTTSVKVVTANTGTAGVFNISLQDSVTLDTSLTISGTGVDSLSLTGKGQSAATTGTDVATTLTTKGYVDGLVEGGLTFKGTFRADTGEILSGGNDGSFLYNVPGGAGTRVAVALGDYYVVATAGGDFYANTSFPLDIGDSIIGVEVAAADTSVIGDWSLVSQGVTVNSFTNVNGNYVSAVTENTNATGAVTMGTIDLSAVDGTSDVNTKFLSKDNTWDVPSYTTNTDETYDLNATQSGVDVDLNLTSTSGADNSVVKLKAPAGGNITLTRDSSTVVSISSRVGKRVDLDSTDAWVTRTVAGGLTTFAVTVTNSNVFGAGTAAIDAKCEVLSAAGQTVYADVTRSGTVISIEFTGTIADSAFQTLLTYVG
jgi:hypothetical protein